MNGTSVASEVDGRSILAGGQVALRYSFIPAAHWYGEAGTSSPASWLDLVHDEIERSAVASQYVEPLASFYVDVTVPFTRRRRLPIAAMVEPIADWTHPPQLVEIDIDAIETIWEGHVHTVPPVRIMAQFRDAIAFFESGHVVYSPSFLLQAPVQQPDGSVVSSNVLNPLHVSALTSLVSSPSAGYGQDHSGIRSKISFRYIGAAQGQDLATFVNNRLRTLADPQSTDNVFADLIRPVLLKAGWTDQQRDKARNSVAGMTWSNLRSASVEVVGAERHDDVITWCRAAADEKLRVDTGAQALAALSQNILDVDNQDEHEVIDSLSQAVIVHGEVLLIHPQSCLRYSHYSRSFAEMRDVIGGCPYFMLTNLVLAYNEYLLDRSARLIDRVQRVVRHAGWTETREAGNAQLARDDLKARVQLFEHQTLHVLPNIFRYPTERTMFDEIVRQRGLGQRAAGIERFTHNLYELRKDAIDLAEREGSRRTNALLMALGIFQVSGLLLTALGLTEFGDYGAPRFVVWGVFFLCLLVGVGVAAFAFARKK